MPARESRLHYILLPLAALIVIHPLIIHGCSCGHDFNFHLLSWMDAARQFTHGNLHPHWAYAPAWNAGEPRFIFYPPISWTIGAILGLILPWTWTPIIYTWLALTAAGFSLYYAARTFTTQQAALIAATIYMVNPYMLFTAYERTAYAELLAATWIPLLLHAILRGDDEGGVTIPRIAIPVALLWLTNAPAAVMGCYALALLALIRLITTTSTTKNPSPNKNPGTPHLASEMLTSRENATTRRQLAINTTAGTLLGLGLAAIYVLPAAYERRFVQVHMAIVPGVRIQDNFIFTHLGIADHDGVLHTASVVALLVILLTAAFIAISYLKSARQINPSTPNLASARWASHTTAIMTILTLAIIFLLTPLSNPIWNHTPDLLFLQFPWRLLAILGAVMGLAAAAALSPLKLNRTPTILIVVILTAAITAPSYRIFRQYCGDEDAVSTRLALFQSNAGSDPTDEYAPTNADNDALTQSNPAYWLSEDPKAPPPPNSTPAQTPTHLSLTTSTPQTLILNLRDYPTWRITRNGTVITTHEHRDDGLIAIPIPAGPSSITINWAQSPDQTLADIITAISLILLLITLRSQRTKPNLIPDT